MKFTTPTEAALDVVSEEVRVGNVYPARHRNTKFWLIACVTGRMCHCLGLGEHGEIVSTTTYGVHVFEERELLGVCEEMRGLELQINWRDR